MDIDRFILRHQASWDRLADLTARAGRGARGLGDAEVEELLALYQRTSAHLAFARTHYQDPPLLIRLSRLVGAARSVLYRPRGNPGRTLRLFVTRRFPAAVWHQRRFILVSALVTFVPALLVGVWMYGRPDALAAAIPEEAQQVIAEEQFASYYSSEAAGAFATRVTVNNIRVGLLAMALGVIPILGVGRVLLMNGLNLGIMGAVMHRADRGEVFWGLITPHGLLELAAIVVAGGAGLAVSWAIVAPGDRTRRAALTEVASRSVVTVIGLVGCFVIAGLIEGFVTPSDLPTFARVTIGVIALGAFVAYIATLGPRAARIGLTGLLTEPTGDEPAPLTTDRRP